MKPMNDLRPKKFLTNIHHCGLRILIICFLFVQCKKDDTNFSRWKLIPTDYKGDLRSVCFLSKDIGLIIGNTVQLDSTYSILLHSVDGGESWQTDTCNVKNFIISAAYASAGAFYAEGSKLGQGNYIYKSTDGKTWFPVHSIHVGLVYFFNNNNGLMFDLSTIYITSNAVDFSQVYSDVEGYAGFNNIQFLDDLNGYASGGASHDGIDDGMMAKTANGGQSWQKVPAPPGNITAFYFISKTEGYIFFNSGNLYKTMDGGTNWIIINNDIPLVTGGCYFLSRSEGLEVSSDRIYHTVDGGQIWNVQYDNKSLSDNSLTQLYAQPLLSHSIFVIGKAGLILKSN